METSENVYSDFPFHTMGEHSENGDLSNAKIEHSEPYFYDDDIHLIAILSEN